MEPFEDEVGLNQIMIAIDPGKANPSELTDSIVDRIVADIKSSTPEKEGGEVLYPENGSFGVSATTKNMESQ